MGALVTLELPPDSPVRDLPWIITFGPLTDGEDWEPVACGPYERPHALALAEEIVADEDLMAVVEPLMSHVAPHEIRDDIAMARVATSETDGEAGGADATWRTNQEAGDHIDLFELDGHRGPGADASGDRGPAVQARHMLPLPTPDEIRAGMARVVRPLAD
jgi:hypothetical protein